MGLFSADGRREGFVTLRRLLDEIHRLGMEDGELDDEVIVEDILDYCAMAGVAKAGSAGVGGSRADSFKGPLPSLEGRRWRRS